jgi:ADP-heptose:LPS heptosyltransferase
VTARVLVTRLDSLGDVLLAGPAVRAVAARADVVFLCGPRGRAAADLLPGVHAIVEWEAPWIDPQPGAVNEPDCRRLVEAVRAVRPTAAAILGSSHQSPLPLALLLRFAGVGEIAAVSHDYAGALLDHRLRGDPDVHEVVRSLQVVEALGYPPAGAGGRDGEAGLDLAVRDLGHPPPLPEGWAPGTYVAVHPGASVPARTLSPDQWRGAVAALGAAGWRVAVTGSAADRELTAHVTNTGSGTRAGGRASSPGGDSLGGDMVGVVDLAGDTDLAELGAVFAGAAAVATGNTGPMHLAAAVGTPVVAAFPPTVPAERWRPWNVPHVLLGDQAVPCAGCRSHRCPLPRQICTADVTPGDVAAAVGVLTSSPTTAPMGAVSA